MDLNNTNETFLFKFENLIRENIANANLDVTLLSEKLGLSRTGLYARMRGITDAGISNYINKIRLDRAAELLTSTDLTIFEVAEQSGFANQRYFSTVFKQIKGSSPTRYREIYSTNKKKRK